MAIRRIVVALMLMIATGLAVKSIPASQSPAGAPASELRIQGSVAHPLTLTAADLKKMPRKTVTVLNPHEQKTAAFEGVPLEEVLAKAGVPQGESLRGPALATYILADANDGYKVVFSLGELDAGMADADVLIADTMDGGPLGLNQGPFRLVVPHDKRPARWVRMLKSLTVVQPAN
jgi:DMSO/TMAO reductase YedYZ molybdopterin-dependent catalytic subunit